METMIIYPFLFNRRYLAYEFNQKMDTNITEDDVQYSIESDIPQQQNTYDCKSMPLVRRGLTPLILLVVRHSK